MYVCMYVWDGDPKNAEFISESSKENSSQIVQENGFSRINGWWVWKSNMVTFKYVNFLKKLNVLSKLVVVCYTCNFAFVFQRSSLKLS